ncbi:MAG: metallophosphoesterase [Saprospiraceae bacterium]|nr:metallophosphoesterase [Saprospiraceae bacterium]
MSYRIISYMMFALIFNTGILKCQEVLLSDKWYFSHGGAGETLYEYDFPPFENFIPVALPHSVLSPNSALWYYAKMKPLQNGYLRINTDDGAQLWINNERIHCLESGFYPVTAANDSLTVVVRVLNNAMSGGLKSVQWISPSEYKSAENIYQIALHGFDRIPSLIIPDMRDTELRSFSFWGDSQGGLDTFALIIKSLAQHNDMLTVGLGISSNRSDPAQWIQLNTLLNPLIHKNTGMLLIPGNHDYDGYYDNLYPAFYHRYNNSKESFGYHYTKNCAFLILDPNRNFPLSIDSVQRRFADSVMNVQSWQRADWRFVLVHQPPFGQGWPGYSGEDFLAEWFEQNAEKHKVDVVLSGHIHDYERLSLKYGGQRVTFIVSGGAGGKLEPQSSNSIPTMDKVIKKHHYGRCEIQKNSIIVKIYDSEGKILDSFNIQK